MAKKEFVIDNTYELNKISTRWLRRDTDGKTIKPYFFGHVAKTKGYYDPCRKNYMHHNTSMDYLEELIDKYKSPKISWGKKKITDILQPVDYHHNSVNYVQINDIIESIDQFRADVKASYIHGSDLDPTYKAQHYAEMKEQLFYHINQEMKLNISTMLALLRRLESPECKHMKSFLVTILFNIKNSTAFELIKESRTPIEILTKVDEGNETETNGSITYLFGRPYIKKLQKSPKNSPIEI